MFSATLPHYCADEDFIDMLHELQHLDVDRCSACHAQHCSLLHRIVERT